MSGSPKTMNRLPAPVFLSSSSPIARSGFIARLEDSSAGRALAPPRADVRVEGEAAHDEQVEATLTASLAASRTSSGPTVPNSGPMRDGDASASRRRVGVLARRPGSSRRGTGRAGRTSSRSPLACSGRRPCGGCRGSSSTKSPASAAAVRPRPPVGPRRPSTSTRCGDRLSTVNGPGTRTTSCPRRAGRTAVSVSAWRAIAASISSRVMPSWMSGFWAIDFRVTCGTRL